MLIIRLGEEEEAIPMRICLHHNSSLALSLPVRSGSWQFRIFTGTRMPTPSKWVAGEGGS